MGPSKLRVESAELRQSIRRFSCDFQADRKRLLDEDSNLLRLIEDAERGLDSRLQQEVLQQELLDEATSSGGCSEGGTGRVVLDDAVASLHVGLAEEGAAREKADDHVVQAINEYTA